MKETDRTTNKKCKQKETGHCLITLPMCRSILGTQIITTTVIICNTVEKLKFSLFLISCCPEILNSIWLSWYLLLKIACLHVPFTAHENFYKRSKMHCLLIWFSTFQPSEVSENRDPTIKHISTYTLISSSINAYVTDLFLVILFTY